MYVIRSYFSITLITITFCMHALFGQADTKKILVGSPIRKNSQIVKEFLLSLKQMHQECISLDYFFIDDNDDKQSSELLKEFARLSSGNCIIHKPLPTDVQYVCNETTHYWDAKDVLVWRLAELKNLIIKHALDNHYDYLFLIDADLMLNPKTIEHLVMTRKDIIAEVFWTRWQPDQSELPQVWISDTYNLTDEFLTQLKEPGVYEVGGLGACTLISKKALKTGVNFNRIKNVTFWGEDRHFCIRALALGLSLWVDTHFPAYHIYRDSALAGVAQFKKANGYVDTGDSKKKQTLTLSMSIKNEADYYLRQVLEAAREYIDQAVIIDDGSTDDSVKICQEVLTGIPLHIVHNDVSKFSNEVELRKQQWEETLKMNPEWILVLDADEIFETKFKNEIAILLANEAVDAYYFRLYDFWDNEHYREDTYWQAHQYYRPFLVRYKKDFNYRWNEQAQHCGRLPMNIDQLSYATSSLRLKHYGWADNERRASKYLRYKKLDRDSFFGIKEQYESILDESPRLIRWIE